jgi:hypothetical protein
MAQFFKSSPGPQPFEITEFTFENLTTNKDISAGSIFMSLNWGFINIHIKSAWHLPLKPQRWPIWKKGISEKPK